MVAKGRRGHVQVRRGNVVGAEEMAQKYGADTGRLYIGFGSAGKRFGVERKRASKALGDF